MTKSFYLVAAALFSVAAHQSVAGTMDVAAKDLWKAVDTAGKAYDKAKPWVDKGSSGKDLWDKYGALTDGDKKADPNYNPPGAPQVPTSCDASKMDGCKDCYQSAYDKLYKLRANFEKLRAVKIVTEDFTKSSLSFGDSVSGVHGVAGLGWQAERRKIEASFKNFEKAYRAKHQELAQRLNDNLQEIDQCEAKFYGEKDWYNRFGYMYFSFMEDRYRW